MAITRVIFSQWTQIYFRLFRREPSDNRKLAVSKFSGELGEFQILANQQTDTTTWKIMLRLVLWPSKMLLGWTETKLWTLKYGSKSIQTSLILRQRPPQSYELLKFVISLVATVKSRRAPTIWKKPRWKSLCLPILKSITEMIKILRVYVILGDVVSQLETFVWILNHISRSITWSLFTLKASYSVKWPISTWSFMWWCQFIDLLQFETRPSSLLNLGMAYLYACKLHTVLFIFMSYRTFHHKEIPLPSVRGVWFFLWNCTTYITDETETELISGNSKIQHIFGVILMVYRPW